MTTEVFAHQVHSTTDLMNCLAYAAEQADTDALNTLEALEGTVRGWMQPQYETDAQLALIQSLAGLIAEHGN